MANVLFRRGTQEYINNNVPISDGQVVFNETDQAIYVDTPVNNVITRLRYGGGNLSRSDIDSALSDTSENPVQNKVITESVLQKTDVVNDYNTAVAVTATDIPVGCGVIKTANTKIGNLQSALNTTNGTVAQHTADIASLNTGLANIQNQITPIGTKNILSDDISVTASQINTWLDTTNSLTLQPGTYVLVMYISVQTMSTQAHIYAEFSKFDDVPTDIRYCEVFNSGTNARDSYGELTTIFSISSTVTIKPRIISATALTAHVYMNAIRIR